MNPFFIQTFRFIIFISIQVFILNKIPPLHQFITPYLYFLFLLWLPYTINRFVLLLIGFFFGLCLDYLSNSPGLHAAPCVLIVYIRPFLLQLLNKQEATELGYEQPSIKSMGWGRYLLYLLVFTFIHHFYLTLIEWLEFGNFIYFVGKVAASTGISMLLILLTEMLFPRNVSFKTNS